MNMKQEALTDRSIDQFEQIRSSEYFLFWVKLPFHRKPKLQTSKMLEQICERVEVRFEVSTAVIIKSAVFWDIKIQFLLHRRQITSSLQSPAS
jgi:hypothetical protein